jgi:hypothetical protein
MIDGTAAAALDLDIVCDRVLSSLEKQGRTLPAPYVLHIVFRENQSPCLCL